MFHSHKSIIDAWPDLQSYAVDIDVTYEAAKQMKRRDSIPDEYWQATVSGALRRGLAGVTLEILASISASRRKPKPEVGCLKGNEADLPDPSRADQSKCVSEATEAA